VGVSVDQIRRVVALSLRAPSADNDQALRFHWTGTALLVSQNEERGRHVLNAGNLASYLTLGCHLEALRLAAQTEGLQADFTLDAPPRPPGAPWARVSFAVDPGGRRDNGAALLARYTDRRAYRGDSTRDPPSSAAARSRMAARPRASMGLPTSRTTASSAKTRATASASCAFHAAYVWSLTSSVRQP
jgi:hypothetical protein